MSFRAAVVAGLFVAAFAVIAQEPKKDEPKNTEKKQYKPGDMSRPRPKVELANPRAGTARSRHSETSRNGAYRPSSSPSAMPGCRAA